MMVSDQLRAAIVASGKTHYRIGKDTDVNIRTIDRFVGEDMPIKSFTMDALCAYLGLELRPTKRKTRAKQTTNERQTTAGS